MSDIYDRLKRAYRRGTGVRLSADEVTMLLEDTAIQDAVYDDYEEFAKDRDGEKSMEKYIKITLHDGGSYVQPLSEIHQAMDGELDGLQVGDKITLDFEMVEMTGKEYENLPDFDGH